MARHHVDATDDERWRGVVADQDLQPRVSSERGEAFGHILDQLTDERAILNLEDLNPIDLLHVPGLVQPVRSVIAVD